MSTDNQQLMIIFFVVAATLILAVARVRVIAYPLCFLACCRLQTYLEIQSVKDRVNVVLRGVSVIVSPLAFTIALAHNGAAIIGNSTYLAFLPVAVFMLDWMIVANSARANQNDGSNGSLSWAIFFRILLLFCSLLMAVFAGLGSEAKNLVKNLWAVEDAKTRNSAEWKSRDGEIQSLKTQIDQNTQALASRVTLQNDALKYRRLNGLECNSPNSFVDSETGIKIFGGSRCGPRADKYLADAVAAESQLDKLKERETANNNLHGSIKAIETRQQELLTAGRSDPNSMGTLFVAIESGAVDIGLLIKIYGVALVLVLVESMALCMSNWRVPAGAIDGESNNQTETSLAIKHRHTANLAEINAQHRERRGTFGRNLPPLVLNSVGKPNRALHLVVNEGKETGND